MLGGTAYGTTYHRLLQVVCWQPKFTVWRRDEADDGIHFGIHCPVVSGSSTAYGDEDLGHPEVIRAAADALSMSEGHAQKH